MTNRSRGFRGNGSRLLLALLLAALFAVLSSSTALAAPSWLAPVNLSAPGREASNSTVAMDEAGDTVAIWERQSETGIDNEVQVSTRGPGENFSAPVRLSAAATEPDVAMTPSGEAVAIWRHFEVKTGEYVIEASFRPPGGVFSAPLEVSTSPAAALPQDLHLALNERGDAALVWIQQDPNSGLKVNPSFVDASVRPAGGSFSTPETISPLPLVSGQSAERPRLAIDAGGKVSAVWEYNDGTDQLIQTATRPPAGTFSAPQSLSADGEDGFGPDIAMDSAGAATVIWDRFKEKESSYTVESATSPPGGPFGAAVALSSASPSSLGEPVIAITPGGLATAAWTQSDGSNNIVQAARGSSGGGFSTPLPLSPSGQEALDPEVAVNASGAATVVWKGSDGTNDIVESATGPATGSFSPAVGLSVAGQDAVFPRVAIDGGGDATVVWWRSNGANEIVQAAGYDADAPTLGNLSIPASGIVGTPVSFSVKPFDVWPIASTTFSFGDGAEAVGVGVSHAYTTPGTYRVTVTSKDAAASTVTASGEITILPSNEFLIGRFSPRRKLGTGTLALTLPGPGKLVLSGRGVKRERLRPKRAGKVRISVRARGAAHKTLLKRGQVKLALSIAFTPSGGTTRLKHKNVTLIKKLH
jgi:PKD repeat protein